MQLEDIAPGQVLEGIIPDALAWVITVLPFPPDACAVIYRDTGGVLGERLLGRQHEPLVRIPSHQRPWAFDADGPSFRAAAIECLQAASDASRRLPANACRLLQRGAFLLDPSRRGLSPELLLLVACSQASPGESPASRRVGCLAIHPLGGGFSMTDSPFDRLQSIDAAHWPRLHDALAPLLANRRIRDQALASLANQLAAPAPHPVWMPPVVLGATVLVSADLLQWLQSPGEATEVRPTLLR